MRLSGFFLVYSLLTLSLLVEVTLSRENVQDIVGSTLIYAIVIPLVVASILLIGSIIYEYLNHKTKTKGNKLRTPVDSLLRIAGFIGVGAFLSLIPSILSYYLKPILGWTLLPIIILTLYWVGSKLEGS